MGTKVNLDGKRFGRWLVTGRAETVALHTFWFCHCDCGATRAVRTKSLLRGASTSCGCFNRDVVGQIAASTNRRHGMTRTPTYTSWQAMRTRCENPRRIGFANYGGRGIAICERWHSFENFLADMGERPIGASLDRLNNDGNYEPGNCRWATRCEQNRNRRSVRMTPARVHLVRWLAGAGMMHKEIVEVLGVTVNMVGDATRGRTFKELRNRT